MTLHEQLVAARKKKGLTQEELAEQSKVTVRTIQRLESGESVPRPFTLRAIAAALDTPFESLQSTVNAKPGSKEEEPIPAATHSEEAKHFLQTLCLSCFSFLPLPFLHFLIPAFILRRRKGVPQAVLLQGRKLVRGQVFWVIGLQVMMLLTVGFNLYRKGKGLPVVSYLVPAAAAYAFNLATLLLFYFSIPRRVVG